ncbi:beta-lactamase family protein [Balneolaceae bacterium YR4-1]|uniref:Beta-lactamase family protein n=1 Tax=Halalkalibaculum roseum TaxID=2709311 RepID=A0A6M1SY25_9BACT|nr:serine hydrolase domain-containing protein [Halalkalibaculum roseum]NGP77972.1 beta-lactamase family protein [Halalkalibaculum roseum]
MMKKHTLIGCLLCLIFIQPACSQQVGWEPSMDEYLEFRNELGRFSGTVAISRNDELVYLRSTGTANRSWNIPVNDSTKYDIASVTKMFTAVGIAMLYEDGKIGLDDTILDHFSDFPISEIGAATTIRQLLSHTSGISDFFMQPGYLETDRYRLRELEDYDRFYNTVEVNESQVGTMHYSNTNFMILGRIIEKITGVDFYTYIREKVFDPLGMVNTGFYEHDLVVGNMAVGYTTDSQAVTEFGVPMDGRLRANSYMRPARGMPAGGAYSTVADLLRFMKALRNESLLNSETFEEFTKEDGDGYALGFQSYTMDGIRFVGHSGGFYGVSSQIFYLPEKGYTVAILANNDFGAPPVFDRFISYLTGRKTYKAISLDEEALSRFEGFYEIVHGEMNGKQLEIQVRDDHLLFDNELEFYPYDRNSFFDIDNESFTLRFSEDSAGMIDGFQWTDGRNFTARAKTVAENEMVELQKLEMNDTELETYLGDFEFGDSGMMPGHKPEITIDDGTLLVDGRMRFVPFDVDKFYLQDDKQMQLHYIRNQANEITGFHVKRGDSVLGEVSKLD